MIKQTKLWTTKEGEKIRICDMTDTHLRNSIKMLECTTVLEHKSRVSKLIEASTIVSGEMATDIIESELNFLLQNNLDPEDVYSIYDDLVYDLERRNQNEKRSIKINRKKPCRNI